MRKTLLIILFLGLFSCSSILPYEEDFACNRNPNLGKCVSVEEAYNEAITGVSSKGQIITDDGLKDEASAKGENPRAQDTEKQAYQTYRTALYQQLQRLIANPETPVIKNAQQVRTLILSYSPENQPQRLYMPRYVYSISKGAEFVLGQYRLQDEGGLKTFADFINQEPPQ